MRTLVCDFCEKPFAPVSHHLETGTYLKVWCIKYGIKTHQKDTCEDCMRIIRALCRKEGKLDA